MSAIAKWVRHNQGVFFSLCVMLALTCWIYGCQPVTRSVTDPNKKVTRTELELEIQREQASLEAQIDMLQRTAEARREDLLRQEQLRAKISEFTMLAAEAGTVNPTGVVSLLVSILGIGAVIDNRIKDKVIKNRPLKEEA